MLPWGAIHGGFGGGSSSSAIVHLFKSRILFKSAGMNWELGEVDCGLTFNGAEVAHSQGHYDEGGIEEVDAIGEEGFW